MNDIIYLLRNGLIVSCQALDGNPLKGSNYMAAMALAAELGGAVGIRANGTDDIRAIKNLVSIPVIGINKTNPSINNIYITPTYKEAEEIAVAGADIIALDGTSRERPDGVILKELIERIHFELHLPVMADVSTFEEGLEAWKSGADMVATTLSGFTNYSPKFKLPDFKLVQRLSVELPIPVIAEGRITSPEHLKKVFRLGAYAAVIGKMITNPMFITKKFVNTIQKNRNEFNT